jgi:hypothetical protein
MDEVIEWRINKHWYVGVLYHSKCFELYWWIGVHVKYYKTCPDATFVTIWMWINQSIDQMVARRQSKHTVWCESKSHLSWPVFNRPPIAPFTEYSSRLHSLSTRAAPQWQAWPQLCVAPTVAEAGGIKVTSLCLNEGWTVGLILCIMLVCRTAKNRACPLPLLTRVTGL